MSTAERRQEEKERRRNEIIDAAEHVFALKGVDKATMGDVADQARLSRGLLYVYFKDKDDLYAAITVRAFEQLHRAFLVAAEGGENGLDKIHAVGRAYVSFYREQPQYFQAMADMEAREITMAEASEAENVAACLHEGQCILQFMASLIQEGMADGSIRADVGDPLLTAVNLWGFTHGLIQIAAQKSDMLFQMHRIEQLPLIEQGFAMMLRALAT